MKLDLTTLPSLCTKGKARESCPDARCRCRTFEWVTNGDGGLLQVCKACGRAWGVGRFWVDKEIGPRAESQWSTI